jgi:Bacterial PH domain
MPVSFRGRSSGRVYRCHWYPKLQAGLILFMAVVCLSVVAGGHSVGERVVGGVLGGILLVVAFRAVRAGTVIATDDGLVIRNVVRTHRVPYEEIRSVEAEIRRVGPGAYRRSCLLLEFRDGRRKAYTEFNSPPGDPEHPARVEVIARELNSLVRRRVVENRQPHIHEGSTATT